MAHLPLPLLNEGTSIDRLKRSKIRVFLGDHDQYQSSETPAIMRAVSAVIRHRNFDVNTYNHDIALLKLRKPVTFTKRVRPVCFPQSGESALPVPSGEVLSMGVIGVPTSD
jgi:hypothetical protein